MEEKPKMIVTKEEHEKARDRSRRMYQSDLDSNKATIEHRAKLAIAGNLLKRNRPVDEIVEDTGLTREEVGNLRTTS